MRSHDLSAFFVLPYPQAFTPTTFILISLHDLTPSPPFYPAKSRHLYFALCSVIFHETLLSTHCRPALALISASTKHRFLTHASSKSAFHSNMTFSGIVQGPILIPLDWQYHLGSVTGWPPKIVLQPLIIYLPYRCPMKPRSLTSKHSSSRVSVHKAPKLGDSSPDSKLNYTRFTRSP